MDVVFVSLVLFACALIQVTSGFGFALLAMPLVTFVLGIEQAAPLVAVAALFLNTINALRLHRHVNRPALLRLAVAALLGIVPGFWLQSNVPAAAVRTILGVVLVVYAGYTLLQPKRLPTCPESWVWPAGMLGGALGAAYNISGPPVVVYGDMRGWPRNEYRSTLQTFFLATGVMVVAGHLTLGHFDAAIGRMILIALPALLLGNLVGIGADRFLDGDRFRLFVKLLILATGVALLLVGR